MSKSSEPVRNISNNPPGSYSCRFHPTDWFHEVGCPHMEWTPEQLQEAERLRAHSALPTSSGNDKLPQPSLPVESLEATVIDCLDAARKGDDPNALGYYLMGEIDKALQKARIEELDTLDSHMRHTVDLWKYIPYRLKELRDELHTDH